MRASNLVSNRLARFAIGLVLGSLLVAVTGAAPAQAAPQEGRGAAERTAAADVGTMDAINTFRNQATTRCIDDSSLGFRTVNCNGNSHQAWNVHAWNDGTREIKNQYTGRCIDDSDAGFRTYPCNASVYQSWYVHAWADGTIELKNQATGRCIDDSSAGFRTYPCNASVYQSWY